MSALSIFKGKNAKNKNIGRKVNPVNIASLLVYFHFTYELLAFDSFNSFFLLPGRCRFNISMPIYVNMVRDPIERVISWYYYVRAPWYFVERKRAFPDLPLPNPNWLRKVITVLKYVIVFAQTQYRHNTSLNQVRSM